MENVEDRSKSFFKGVHPLTNKQIVGAFKREHGINFAAFTTEQQPMQQPIDVFLGYWVAHFSIVKHVEELHPSTLPIAAGIIDFNLPEAATLTFFPARITGGSSACYYVREGLIKIKETDETVVDPVLTSVRNTLTVIQRRIPTINGIITTDREF